MSLHQANADEIKTLDTAIKRRIMALNAAKIFASLTGDELTQFQTDVTAAQVEAAAKETERLQKVEAAEKLERDREAREQASAARLVFDTKVANLYNEAAEAGKPITMDAARELALKS